MDLTASLHELFGFRDFRRGQREACEAALAGRDVLVVMPTGSGKSLCYQLPALLRDDLTVVVSPLVALMQDQVEALQARGLGEHVALVNAQQDAGANAAALERALAGELRLLYVAPERFAARGFMERMGAARVGLFVVDEAHCVSQWGHDFRPDYFRLADAARALGAGSLVASTATATPRVAADVANRLGLRDPLQVATGFDRPNIAFGVARPAPHEKRALIAECLRGEDALPAIVYTGTRAGAEEVASELTEALGEPAVAYHAGIERERRADVQRRFLADDVRVICATNAFGMGVDKPNVRTVVHATVPSSLEAYYQEAGRAGRDGAPARALLLAENRDKALHVHFIKRDEIDADLPAWLADRLAAAADGHGRFDLEAAGLARDLRGDGDRLRALVGHLTRAGFLVAHAGGPRPAGGQAARALRRPRGGPLPGLGRGGRAHALAPVPRDLGLRRAGRLPAPGPAQPLRGLRRPRPLGRTLLRRMRSRARARAAAARSRASARPGRRDRVGGLRRPPRGRPHALRRDHPRRAHEEDRAQLVRRTARLRRVLAHAPGRHPRARGRPDRVRHDRDLRGPVPGPPDPRARRRLTVAFRIAVLISGEGTNLQALLDERARSAAGEWRWWASRRAARRRAGIERARGAGVDTAVFAIADHPDRGARDRALGDWLDGLAVDLVVLAGFMELLGPEFIRRFAGRILNVHPSLLPAFPGVRAIEQALEHGVKVLGVTVHLVDDGVDSGPIVLQESFPLLPYPRGIAEVEERVHEVEHRLLPRAVRLIAEGRVRPDPGNPRDA